MADGLSPQSNPAELVHTSKRRNLLEFVIGYGLILLVIWTPHRWQRILYFFAITYLTFVVWDNFRSAQAMGLRSTNFLRSLWIVGVSLLLAAISIGIAIRLHTLHPLEGPIVLFKRYWGYAIWCFVQQLLLQDFFLRRLLRLIPHAGWAVLATASIFSMAHLPNPVLTLVTFGLGLVACLLFLRYRNLYPLAISHAILGITIAITLPNPIIRNMRVGLGYITYTEHHGQPHRNHKDHVASTKAWVKPDAPTWRF